MIDPPMISFTIEVINIKLENITVSHADRRKVGESLESLARSMLPVTIGLSVS
jgi:hypothetical protein